MPFACPFNGAASYFAKHRDLRGELVNVYCCFCIINNMSSFSFLKATGQIDCESYNSC